MKLVGESVRTDADDIPLTTEQTSSDDERTDDQIYPRCDECGEINYEWTPGTRGRKPRYHADCKPITPRRATTGRRSQAWETGMREALTARYMQLANIASLAHVAYGMGIKTRIEEAVNADIEYARVNPKFREFLEKSLERTALGAVIAVHAAMLQPVIVGQYAKRKAKTGGPKSPGRVPSEAGRTVPNPPQAGTVREPAPGATPDNVRHIRDDGMPNAESGPLDKPSNAANLDGMPG